jgi:regulatory protein
VFLNDLNTVKAVALRLLARREHSRVELTHKLLKKAFSADLIETVLDQCVEKDWQSDLRFSESYVRTCIARGDGMLKIQMRLRDKGVSQAMIQQVVPMNPDFWQMQLTNKWSKKRVSAKIDIKAHARNIRFLQSRGFTFEQIQVFMSL